MMIDALAAIDQDALDESVSAGDIIKLIKWADGFSWDTEFHPLTFATPHRVLEVGVARLFGPIDPIVPQRIPTELESRRSQWARKSKKIAPLVFERDGGQCKRCGATDHLVVDHIVPISRGGGDDFDNLQALCRTCNSSKGARTMAEWIGAQ